MPCNVDSLETYQSLSPTPFLQVVPGPRMVVHSDPGLDPLHVTTSLPWGDEGVEESQDLRVLPPLPRPCC